MSPPRALQGWRPSKGQLGVHGTVWALEACDAGAWPMEAVDFPSLSFALNSFWYTTGQNRYPSHHFAFKAKISPSRFAFST